MQSAARSLVLLDNQYKAALEIVNRTRVEHAPPQAYKWDMLWMWVVFRCVQKDMLEAIYAVKRAHNGHAWHV
ncbi:MAG: hypothetical protein WCN27_05675 [Alphaproteobacteria bacterium]